MPSAQRSMQRLRYRCRRMNDQTWVSVLCCALHVLIQGAVIVRVLLRPHREPAARVAWVVIILTVPILGILTYLLFGELNIGRRRVTRLRIILAGLPDAATVAGSAAEAAKEDTPRKYAHLFQVGKTANGFEAVGTFVKTRIRWIYCRQP